MKPDLVKAEAAVADLLAALGIDTGDAHTADTASRVARAWTELLAPVELDLATFPNAENYDELVIVSDIRFHSICAHHMLPFTGVAHVAYLPASRIIGLSKIPRVVEHHSRRLQVQERLTEQIADTLWEALEPKGLGVVMVAEHTCMTLRGVRAQGSGVKTSAMRGILRSDARTRSEFLQLVGA